MKKVYKQIFPDAYKSNKSIVLEEDKQEFLKENLKYPKGLELDKKEIILFCKIFYLCWVVFEGLAKRQKIIYSSQI